MDTLRPPPRSAGQPSSRAARWRWPCSTEPRSGRATCWDRAEESFWGLPSCARASSAARQPPSGSRPACLTWGCSFPASVSGLPCCRSSACWGSTCWWLAESGVLFLVFAALWVAFGAGLVWSQGSVDQAWQAIRDLPLMIQVVIWLLFLPVMLGLWIWETSWALLVRVVLVVGLAGWSLLIFLPKWLQRG